MFVKLPDKCDHLLLVRYRSVALNKWISSEVWTAFKEFCLCSSKELASSVFFEIHSSERITLTKKEHIRHLCQFVRFFSTERYLLPLSLRRHKLWHPQTPSNDDLLIYVFRHFEVRVFIDLKSGSQVPFHVPKNAGISQLLVLVSLVLLSQCDIRFAIIACLQDLQNQGRSR